MVAEVFLDVGMAWFEAWVYRYFVEPEPLNWVDR